MSSGVRKVNEFIMKDGRTIIVTDPTIQVSTVPLGTLYVNPTVGDIKYKLDGESEWVKPSPSVLFESKSIVGNLIADRSINASKIALNSIGAIHIQDGEINSSKLANNSVTELKIASGSITNSKIKDRAITNSKIELDTILSENLVDSAIITQKINDLAITTSKINDLAVTTDKINNLAVTTSKINDLAVNTDKINNLAITNSKLDNNAVSEIKIGTGSVSTRTIQDQAVTESKIATDSVTAEKIKELAIVTNKLANGAVVSAKIADNAVLTSKIANRAVTEGKLEDSLIKKINDSIRVNIPTGASIGTATVGGNMQINGSLVATGDITGARVFNAHYNDLAEGFIPSEYSQPGHILEVDDSGRVKKASSKSKCVVGVHSDCYAQLFGATPEEVEDGFKIAVGMIGRVPVLVAGQVKLGDLITTLNNGIGVADNNAPRGTIIGKAIANKYSQGIDKVLCYIFPA